LLAQQEGLLLDPSYTSKAMAGMLSHLRDGWWQKGQTLIFLHTGGTPALFAYAEDLGY
jgi:D-cysteine desulfhydrase